MTDLSTRIAHRLRRERARSGIGISELARRSGVSKGTISQLENGVGNPSVETLWALGDALGVPFSVFVEEVAPQTRVVRAGEHTGISAAHASYAATLLAAAPPGARSDLYLIRAEPGTPRQSEPHISGTTEHVVLVSGSARVGPTDTAEVLRPGDYMSYPGDAPHIFEALEPDTSAVLVSEVR